MKRKLPEEYRERAKVETVHSVIKRRFGDFLRSMNKINSRKEEIMKFLYITSQEWQESQKIMEN
ncbi:MAG: hypothetical protein ACP5TO_02540 [Thermoplasmata archaeon]